MNFRRRARDEEPEINLVPMIDVLLVVLIFLMVTTTFVRPAALKIRLPGSANAQSQSDAKTTLLIRVSADGLYSIEGEDRPMALPELRNRLRQRVSATPNAREQLTVQVEADRSATHQQVVDALDTVASAGLNRVSIITQKR